VTLPVPDGDAERLVRLIDLEEAAALAHRLGGTGLGEHEAQHADALRSELAGFTVRHRAAPTRADQLSGPARALAEGDRRAAITLEKDLIATYLREVPALIEDGIVRTAATILASHAQHLTVLRGQAPWRQGA
jgi:hypothetical protein